MSDPSDLAAFLDHGWALLNAGLGDPAAAARHPTFATVARDGQPQARTVVLRGVDRSLARLEVHTDAASAKCDDLNDNPRAAFHIWEPQERLQIRLATDVTVVAGDAAADRWARVPDASRAGYGAYPPPGDRISDPYAAMSRPELGRFAVLICQVACIDLLELGDRHRRAVFKAADNWSGHWVTP